VSRSPIAEAREFDFVKDDDVRAILERDYVEAQTAFAAQCWKSVIILCGGVIEATLLDLLLTDPAAACAAKGAPKGKPDLRKLDLSDVIRVAVELGIVGPGLDRLSDTLRQYRNLIHPGVELRSGLSPQKEEAPDRPRPPRLAPPGAGEAVVSRRPELAGRSWTIHGQTAPRGDGALSLLRELLDSPECRDRDSNPDDLAVSGFECFLGSAKALI